MSLQEKALIVMSFFLALEQVLAMSNKIKANSTFQLICNATSKIIDLLKK